MFEDLEVPSIGVVVRNSSGEILAALSKIIPLPSSIVVLETIVVQRAVTFLQELGLSSSIFKEDSETSILAIKNHRLFGLGLTHYSKFITQNSYLKLITHISKLYLTNNPKLNSLFGSNLRFCSSSLFPFFSGAHTLPNTQNVKPRVLLAHIKIV